MTRQEFMPPHNGAKVVSEAARVRAAKAAYETMQIARLKRNPKAKAAPWDALSEATQAVFVAIASNALCAFNQDEAA